MVFDQFEDDTGEGASGQPREQRAPDTGQGVECIETSLVGDVEGVVAELATPQRHLGEAFFKATSAGMTWHLTSTSTNTQSYSI